MSEKRTPTRTMSIDLGYWMNIAVAVFFVWRASESDDRGAMFLLFAAAFMIIHAHGYRIHEAIKAQVEGKA